jgi:hypothetical protein
MEFRKIDPWAPQRIPLASKTSTRKWSEELPEFSNRKPGNLAGKIRKNIFRETGKSGGKKPGKTSLDFRDLY